MKNNSTRRFFLVIALSPCLFSCLSSRSHSVTNLKTVTSTIYEVPTLSKKSDLLNPSGQRASHSSGAQLRQAEDFQAHAANDKAFLNEEPLRNFTIQQKKLAPAEHPVYKTKSRKGIGSSGASLEMWPYGDSRNLDKQGISLEKTKALSTRMKASLQNVQAIIKTNEAELKAGNQFTKSAKNQEHRSLRAILKEAKITADDQQTLEVILAIILAPLGVYLHERKANKPFWISLALWAVGIGLFWTIPFLGLLPAIIFSLLVVTDTVNIQ